MKKILGKSAITKMQAILVAAIVIIALVTGTYIYFATLPPSPPEKVKLVFVGWAYDAPTIEGNLDEFMERNPDIEVESYLYPPAGYPDKVLTMVAGGAQIDVLYVRDSHLGPWHEWLYAIEEFPGVDAYYDDMYPLVQQALTWEGQRYGLPYFAAWFALIKNDVMLEQAGIDRDPETWQDFVDICVTIKEKGIAEYPVVWNLDLEWFGVEMALSAVIASKGGTLFDENYDYTSKAVESLQFLYDCIHTWEIISPAMLVTSEFDAGRLFAAGEAAYFIQSFEYAGSDWANNPEISSIVGKAHIIPMPEEGTVIGYCRMYAMTKTCENKDAAWKLMEFLGGKTEGKYIVAERWCVRAGLGWGQKSLTYSEAVKEIMEEAYEPGFMEVWEEQADNSVYIGMGGVGVYGAAWYPEWRDYAAATLQDSLLGDITPEEALSRISDKAKALATS